MARFRLWESTDRNRSFALTAFTFLVIICSATVSTLTAADDTAPAETIAVPNLHQPVEILIDRWGVPHIYAKDEADLFFAQGFNAARDRLFQIDLWQRRGLGRLAEAFGPAFVEQDKATRLFLYRGDMNREWVAYSRDAQKIARSFVAGINAYIDWLEQHPDRTPFEFKKLKYKPAKWTAEDVVRIRSHGLTGNLDDEIARAKMACAGDLMMRSACGSNRHGKRICPKAWIPVCQKMY